MKTKKHLLELLEKVDKALAYIASQAYDPHEDDDMDTFVKLFNFSLSEMARVYMMHRKEKGDSWQNAHPEELRTKLKEEIGELSKAKRNTSEEYHELTDLLNVGFMLLERLATKQNKK